MNSLRFRGGGHAELLNGVIAHVGHVNVLFMHSRIQMRPWLLTGYKVGFIIIKQLIQPLQKCPMCTKNSHRGRFSPPLKYFSFVGREARNRDVEIGTPSAQNFELD